MIYHVDASNIPLIHVYEQTQFCPCENFHIIVITWKDLNVTDV